MQRVLTFPGAHERFLAYLIDTILLIVIGTLVLGLLQSNEAAAMLLSFFISAAYFTYFQAGRMQASVGMRMVGMYLVQLNGRPLHWKDALARYLIFMVPSYPLYLSFLTFNEKQVLALWLGVVWYATIALRPDRAGLHDIICRMRVVRGRVQLEK